MNNISKYRKLIINTLLILGIAGIIALMKTNQSHLADEPSKLKTQTESISAFEMVTLKFL